MHGIYKGEGKKSLSPEDAQRLIGSREGNQSTGNYYTYHSKLIHGRLISLGELGREVGFGQ